MHTMKTKAQQNTPMNPQPGFNKNSTDTASMDSTAQTGHSGAYWQEEIYLKIQAMREAYLAEVQEFHLKISRRYQQNEMLPHAKQTVNFEKLKKFKGLLERILAFLQISRSSITSNLKERLPMYEKQIVGLLSLNRRPRVTTSPQQGQQQLQNPVGHARSTPQHQPSQVLQVQWHENHGNLVHQLNMPGSITTMQSAMTYGPTLAVPATQKNATTSVPSASELDHVQVNFFGSLQQSSMGSIQQSRFGPLQNSIIAAQQDNLNNLAQSSLSGLQPNATSMQNSKQHLKHEQQEHLMQNQQLKQQLEQRQILQQLLLQQQRATATATAAAAATGASTTKAAATFTMASSPDVTSSSHE